MIDTSVYTFRAKICTPRRANIPHTHDSNQTKNLSTNSPHIARLEVRSFDHTNFLQHYVPHCFREVAFLSFHCMTEVKLPYLFTFPDKRYVLEAIDQH
ncbi:hypothetical protein CDAR_262831 [Caerostris darwini]|uniref:Uncharacterized protein n=1 Tax=Caerostris darwini TaxID=1538125 RepID=A0AAV4RZ58_9ARAC|nr:hypothetical protein CDAR_262831 [Caerostris darwini]